MTDGQDSLFPPGQEVTPLRALTVRQMRVYEWICEQPAGVEAIDVGAHFHAEARRHMESEYCEWCGRDGARVLREKAIRVRLIRRAGGIYEPRDHGDWTGKLAVASDQLEALNGETFEDIFGDAAA